jgi:hypothetical protein
LGRCEAKRKSTEIPYALHHVAQSPGLSNIDQSWVTHGEIRREQRIVLGSQFQYEGMSREI